MVPNNFKLIKQDYIISNTSTNKKNLIPSNTANNVMRLKIGADCYLIKDANHNLSLSKLVSSSFTTANVSLNNNCCPTNDESKGTKIDNQCSRTKNHRSNTIPRATLAKMQRYSMGDYLRSLILEDLHSPDFIGKSEQQIAADRCIKIMKFFDNPEKKFRRKQFNNRCRDECNIRRYRSQSDANLKAMSYLINSRCFCCKLPMTVDNGSNGSEVKENNDLATNYFRRVYEFLKQQPKDGRSSSAMGKWSYFHKNHQTDDEDGYEKSDDTSSSSCDAGKISQRRIINGFQGEEALCLHRTTDQEEEEEDDADSANFFRPQLRDIFDNKHRPRPPLPVKCRVNTRDISKYFDYPNKENRPGWCTSPPAKEMGSNLSRHHGKGLTGRRTQSSGNLCEPKGKINHVGKMLVPCSSTSSEERYKFSGSLPNYLDNDSNSLIDDLSDNNNTLADTICGNLGGTLPHKKPHYEQNHVKYHSHDSLEGDPWRYQQSNELDVVRCKHGTLDIVRRSNRDSHEHAFSSNTMVRHSNRSHPDLDIVAGTLPTRRIDPKWCDPAGIGPIHQRNPVDTVDGSFAKVVHKPDCELMKHRQVERCQAARKSKRIAGEHQDQGYASERSPEDEHPPVIAPDSGLNLDRTFRVTLQKSSRGLGLSVSGGGASGPIRIKRLFPQQPAALSNKLQPGDILLAANGVPLTSLTNYEALEVLRTSANTVELLVCRQPGENSITPPGAPPTPPARREAPRVLNPVTPLNIEPCGEFDIEMTKVEGSLGFTLRKVDSSALGHYVRALVREPALSDGRIQPGDKIVAVDGAPLSPMSHEEAVALLRQCGPKVKLRLYRDLAQTPVSALSPTEPDHPLHLSRTSLRQEAMDMLCDLAVRKLSPSASDGLGNQNTANATSSSPRKLRKPRTPSKERSNDTNHVSTVVQTDPTDSDDYSNLLNSTSSGTAADSDASRAARPKFLDLSSSSDRTDIQFGLDTSSECRDRFISSMIHPVDAEYALYKRDVIAGVIQDNNLPTEPVSMPPVSCDATFSYKNPAYQSANPTCSGSDHIKGKAAAYSSDQNIPGRLSGSDDPAGNKGLLKWKGVMFAPDDSNCSEKDAMQNNNLREINPVKEDCEIFMVELTRGWNSRLGFSLQAHENGTIISMVHPDSVAAKDGRLKQGDILLMVNDESVTDVPTNEIIDLLRKIRGSIGITVARKKKQSVT